MRVLRSMVMMVFSGLFEAENWPKEVLLAGW